MTSPAPAFSHARTAGTASLPGGIDLRTVADELIRDLIRRDPALWARVQDDPVLRRDFGFDTDERRA